LRQRRDLENQVGGLLRGFGLEAGQVRMGGLQDRIEALRGRPAVARPGRD
jgi:hypothetical protein